VAATNLNGVPQVVTGTWTLYRLEPPAKLYRERLWNMPDTWILEEAPFRKLFPLDPWRDEDIQEAPHTRVTGGSFTTTEASTLDLSVLRKAKSGKYCVVFEAADPSGEKVTRETRFLLFDNREKTLPVPAFFHVRQKESTAEPGQVITLLAGSSMKTVLRYTLELEGKVLEERWIDLKGQQQPITIPVQEHFRGGFSVHFAGVWQNRSFNQTVDINVPYSNKQLDIRFATFRDQLQPGETEEYRVTITGNKGERVMAELLTGMYDASLDVFAVNNWRLNPWSSHNSLLRWSDYSFDVAHGSNYGQWPTYNYQVSRLLFDRLNWFGYLPGYGYVGSRRYFMEGGAEGEGLVMYDAALKVPGKLYAPTSEPEAEEYLEEAAVEEAPIADSLDEGSTPGAEAPAVVPRTRFDETAFFYPQLKTDEEGNVVFSYRVPEALTSWKLLCLAHTPDLKTGILEKNLVTQKELMVIPNPPRFFREGDRIIFTAKVTNLSDTVQSCHVVLKLFNGLTGEPFDNVCHNLQPHQSLSVDPGQSGVASWELQIPEKAGAITYRVTASSATFSDGEEMTIPVLTNRMLVTETLPLPLTGKQTKSFRMEKLLKSGSSTTLTHHRLTLEYTSHPAWYAVQALPYLMEFPYECSEQLFSRFYANSLATYIAQSSPKIKQVFDSWKSLSPDALRSNLEKNQELKALMLEETPWLLQAASESERKQRVALLFDLNRMSNEMGVTLHKLQEQQSPNGGWPWFKGGPDSWYITQHIATGIGRLTKMGVVKTGIWPGLDLMTTNAVRYLDQRMDEYYANLKKLYKDKPTELDNDHLSHLTIMYLYTRSFYLTTYPPNNITREAFEWVKKQGMKYWTKQDLMMQGYLAMALNRLDQRSTALLIMKSLKERSLANEELGMYWRTNAGYYWYEAPIERQALLIEAFAEVTGDYTAVEQMKIWLLKQKQTHDWKSTKATTEACYALLLQGTDLLSETALAQVTVGDKPVDPYSDGSTTPGAGTGYFKVSWDGTDIAPAMGNVTVTGTSESASWGALYWQDFEQIDKITP
ncbi:MAG: alpha-2-macroglobulin family protein, partial [Dehalococcoidales bacterium]|nr:alpha-2-macroglobulin family protein [Dehalococcoidales bacterium]